MKKIKSKGWDVEIWDDTYLSDIYLEMIEELMENQLYNTNTDWERYRQNQKWKARRTS